MIKKFKQKTVTKIGKGDTDDDTEIHDVEIELYDAQAAAEKILRIHGKFVEKHEIKINNWKKLIDEINSQEDTE